MKQEIKFWIDTEKNSTFYNFLKSLLDNNYEIQQVISDKVSGNELFYKIDRAIVIVKKISE